MNIIFKHVDKVLNNLPELKQYPLTMILCGVFHCFLAVGYCFFAYYIPEQVPFRIFYEGILLSWLFGMSIFVILLGWRAYRNP